eukprot:15080821-Alexandrium_andersonii.AAC.1
MVRAGLVSGPFRPLPLGAASAPSACCFEVHCWRDGRWVWLRHPWLPLGSATAPLDSALGAATAPTAVSYTHLRAHETSAHL